MLAVRMDVTGIDCARSGDMIGGRDEDGDTMDEAMDGNGVPLAALCCCCAANAAPMPLIPAPDDADGGGPPLPNTRGDASVGPPTVCRALPNPTLTLTPRLPGAPPGPLLLTLPLLNRSSCIVSVQSLVFLRTAHSAIGFVWRMISHLNPGGNF